MRMHPSLLLARVNHLLIPRDVGMPEGSPPLCFCHFLALLFPGRARLLALPAMPLGVWGSPAPTLLLRRPQALPSFLPVSITNWTNLGAPTPPLQEKWPAVLAGREPRPDRAPSPGLTTSTANQACPSTAATVVHRMGRLFVLTASTSAILVKGSGSNARTR